MAGFPWWRAIGVVVQNPRQEDRMHNHEKSVARQRKLHFEDDELWTIFPEECGNVAAGFGRKCWQAFCKNANGGQMSEKIKQHHLERGAYVYVRQSTPYQVRNHLEGKERQYSLAQRAKQLGFGKVIVMDEDFGRSGGGLQERPGF